MQFLSLGTRIKGLERGPHAAPSRGISGWGWSQGGNRCVGLSLLLLATFGGCGGNENLAYVSGTVRLDGEPLPNAFIVFAPINGGSTSYGRTDQDGKYEMMFSDDAKGAWIGENRVEISTGDVDATGGGGGARELVPAAYNQRSNLTAEVTAGDNVHNFDLESDAGRILQLPSD